MEFAGYVRNAIETASLLIEILAVLIILLAIVNGGVRYVTDLYSLEKRAAAFHNFKVRLGSGLLLGLEILVAGDVIRTVALEPTMENVFTLGMLVAIRTFLSWSLVVEMEGRWPWQKKINE